MLSQATAQHIEHRKLAELTPYPKIPRLVWFLLCAFLSFFAHDGRAQSSNVFPPPSGGATSCSAPGANWITCTISGSTLTLGAAIGQTSHQVIGTGSGSSFGPISLTSADLPAVAHSVTFGINGGGSTIAAGATGQYIESEFASSSGIDKVATTGTGSTAGSACSITVDVWKTNAAVPTSGNKISASDPATLSSAQYSVDTTLTGWTTSVAVSDVWSASVATVVGCINATVQVWWK